MQISDLPQNISLTATDLLHLQQVDGLDRQLQLSTLAQWLHVPTFGDAVKIGTPGETGFGVGVCPSPPDGFTPLNGTFTIGADNYGNYRYADGSIMCWIPAFYYRINHVNNPTHAAYAPNDIDVQDYSAFINPESANSAGYALHRGFYDGGVIKSGVFVDKYLCSNNDGIASSIKFGKSLSAASTHNPFSDLTGSPPNALYGVIKAAQTRGVVFFPGSQFIHGALALLSLAQAQAATSAANCAWYDASGVANFPKGCNNNAFGDTNDASLTFTTEGYSGNSALTGSGAPFAKTTHNGQGCGVCDLNGNMWETMLGLTSDGTDFYTLKTGVAMKDLTDGVTLATDAWGAAGLAALYDNIGASYGAMLGPATAVNRPFGATGQVLSEAIAGTAWTATGLGIPIASGGSNAFGNDYFNDFKPNQLCPLAGGTWSSSPSAGVWALNLTTHRGSSSTYGGFRAALYP